MSTPDTSTPSAADFPAARGYPLPLARQIIGIVALLFSAVYVVDAWQTLSVGRWHKPGAAIFPIAVGLLLAISGVAVLLEKRGAGYDHMPATFSLPDGDDLRRLLLVLASFAVYFVLMPVIGNMIASALFLLVAMRILSDKPLLRLAIYAAVMAVTFEIFFVRLLHVQMPGGIWRQWLP
jgi:hypothetical protein